MEVENILTYSLAIQGMTGIETGIDVYTIHMNDDYTCATK